MVSKPQSRKPVVAEIRGKKVWQDESGKREKNPVEVKMRGSWI